MSVLHLIVKYIRLSDSALRHKDDVRISITSLPGHQKDNFTIPSSKLVLINHEFTLQYDPTDTDILFNFRRKNFINGDPIIGKSIIKLDSIPKDHQLETEVKIYETVQGPEKDEFIQIGEMGIKGFIDNFSKKKISSYYSTPSNIPEMKDLTTDGNEPSTPFFRNIGNRRRNKKFVAFEDIQNDSPMVSSISGSKSQVLNFEPI